MYYSDQAIILARRAWREDDLLISSYSEHYGKLVLKARGAKKVLSKLAGHLEPVSLTYVNVAQGKNIDQLIGANMTESYRIVKDDWQKIIAAGWFLGLIDKMVLEKHADSRLFYLIKNYLDFLASCDINYDIAQIVAGFKLWHLLGFNLAHKEELLYRPEIDFIIKHGINDILQARAVIDKKNELKDILNKEIKEHLN